MSSLIIALSHHNLAMGESRQSAIVMGYCQFRVLLTAVKNNSTSGKLPLPAVGQGPRRPAVAQTDREGACFTQDMRWRCEIRAWSHLDIEEHYSRVWIKISIRHNTSAWWQVAVKLQKGCRKKVLSIAVYCAWMQLKMRDIDWQAVIWMTAICGRATCKQ